MPSLRASNGLLADETKMEADDVGLRVAEACGGEAVLHSVRVNRSEDVIGMGRTERLEVQGVLSHEDPSGRRTRCNSAEQQVLIFGRRHVVEHREAGRCGEAIVGQPQSVASATMTSTLVPARRSRRGSPSEGSISTAVTSAPAGGGDRS